MPRHQATPIRRAPGCLWAMAGCHLGTLGSLLAVFIDLKPNPVRFVPSVLAQRAVCEARNIDCRAPMIVDSPSFRSTVM
jgi:hypothetical protein